MDLGLFVMGSRDGTYADILDQAEHAEELGFSRVVLAERHFRHQDLLLPSPLAFAGAVAARTERVRIGVLGRVLSLDHPMHIAEDAATVDVLSGGRLDFGVARASLDLEGHAVFQAPMEESGSRFEEALEVILRAWTEDSFSHEGRHFTIPDVAVHPRPVQRPHPPIFVVAVSEARLSFAAQAGHNAVIPALRPLDAVAAAQARFTAEREAAGHSADGAVLQVNRFVHVAETDEQARDQMREPFADFIAHRAPDLRAALEATYGGEVPDLDQLVEDWLIVGSPATVTRRLADVYEKAGVRSVIVTTNFVTLDHASCMGSMELLGCVLLPALAA